MPRTRTQAPQEQRKHFAMTQPTDKNTNSGYKKARPKRVPADRGLFERPSGSGVWWVRYHDENGREHREKVGPKGLARKVYQKRKTEIQERRFFPERLGKKQILFADMADGLLDRQRHRIRTYREHQRYARYWKGRFRGKTLRQITIDDIEKAIAEKLQGVSSTTVNRYLQFLRHLFNVAIDDGHLEASPMKTLKLFRENNRRTRYLSETEERRLREVMDPADWSLVAVAIHTGLRQGEQLGLRWPNIDFTSGIITIPRAKHGEARHVPMNDGVRAILRDLPSRLNSTYVFPSKTGVSPLDARNFVNRTFSPALRQAGIENFRWHDLRHTFASRLVMAGVDLPTVQALMGHKTMEMTLRYSHLSSDHQLDAVQQLTLDPTGTTTGTRPRLVYAVRPGSVQRSVFTGKTGRARQDSNLRPTGSKPVALSS